MTVGDILLTQPYDFMIFPNGSTNFIVKSGIDNTSVYETTDQTDALGAFQYCRDQMGNAGKCTLIKPSYYPLSDKLSFTPTTHDHQHWIGTSGPRSVGVQIRPTTDKPAFEMSGGVIDVNLVNLYLTHNQVAYSSSLVNMVDRVIDCNIIGCRFYDFDKYVGNAVGMQILNTGTGVVQYRNHIINCRSDGFENFKYYNIQQSTTASNYFISSNRMVECDVWNTKHVIKGDGIAGGQILSENLNNVTYQYSISNALTTGQSVYKLDGGFYGWYWRFTDCMVWDIPSDVNYANLGSSLELELKGCFPSDRIGGAGASKTKIWDYYTHVEGTSTTSGDGVTSVFTITHNLNKVPKYVLCSLTSTNDNTIQPYSIPVADYSTTIFKVKFKRPPASGTNNLTFSWKVFY